MATPLQLLPAVDVSGGRAVRLTQGNLETAADVGNPAEVAHRWQEAGAQWIHLVDLDAAFGRGRNTAALHQVIDRVSIDVELSGGICDDGSLQRAFQSGCSRAVISTAALRAPRWCADIIAAHGDRVAVALDVRGTMLAARGGTEVGQVLFEALAELEAAGCARYVVTDVRRDGMLSGPNLELLRSVCARSSAPVVASGGVATLAHVSAVAKLVPVGVEGAIIGSALHAGGIELRTALQLVSDVASGGGSSA